MKNRWAKLFERFNKDSMKKSAPSRRSLRLESLEARELLSVSSLCLSNALDGDNSLIFDGTSAVWEYAAGKTIENATGMIVLQNGAGEAKIVLEASNDSGASLHWEFVGDSAGWSGSDHSSDSANGSIVSVLTWRDGAGANRGVTLRVWEGDASNKEENGVCFTVSVEWANVSLCVDEAIDGTDAPLSLVYDGPTYLDTQDLNSFITRVRQGVHITTGHAYWDIRAGAGLASGVELTAAQRGFVNGSWGYAADMTAVVDSFASIGNLIQPGYLQPEDGSVTDVYETWTLTKISDFISLVEFTQSVEDDPGTYVLLNGQTAQGQPLPEHQCVNVALEALSSAGIDLEAEGLTEQKTIISFDDNLKAFLTNMKPYANRLPGMDFIKYLMLNNVTSLPYSGYSPGAAGAYLEANGGSVGQFAASDEPIVIPSTVLSTPILRAADVDATAATLVWDSVTGAVAYALSIKVEGGQEELYQAGILGTSLTVTGLEPSTRYSFRLVAMNGSSYSDLSEPVVIETKQSGKETLATPTGLAAAVSGDGVVITCGAVPFADEYKLTYSQDPLFATSSELLFPTNQMTLNGLKNGTYYFFIEAVDTTGKYSVSAPSASASFEIHVVSTQLAAPTQLRVKVSGTTATVTFQESPGANLYDVQYSTNKNFNHFDSVTTAANSVTIENLDHDVLYYFRVQAKDTTGVFAPSGYSAVRTAISTKLETPRNLTATPAGASVAVTYDMIDKDADFYVVYYSTDPTFAQYRYVTSKTGGAEVKNLTPGLTYYFKVQARDTTGVLTSSRFSESVTAAVTQLGSPQNLKVRASGTSAAVTFNETPGADSYLVRYSTDENFAVFSDAVSADVSVTVAGLTHGVPYYFKVQAIDSTGTFASSSFSEVKTATANQLGTPENVAAAMSGTTAVVTYNASVDADFYVIYYSQDETFDSYHYVTSETLEAAVKNLNPGVTYYFKVQARDLTGDYASSRFSDPVSAVSFQLGAPDGLKAKFSGTTATLTFNATPFANNYIIRYSADPAFAVFDYVMSAVNSVTVKGLTLGVLYYFQVVAQDTSGTYALSPLSETVTAIATKLGTPENLTVTASGTTASVRYDKSVGADLYIIYYSQDETFAQYKYVSSKKGSATVRNLEPDATYFFKVQARDSTGFYANSLFSAPVSAALMPEETEGQSYESVRAEVIESFLKDPLDFAFEDSNPEF